MGANSAEGPVKHIPMSSTYTKKAVIGVCGMLIFGTGTMIASKMLLDTESTGKDGVSRNFKKPWYQSTIMFSAMSACIIVHYIIHVIQTRRSKKRAALLKTEVEPHKKVNPKSYLLIGMPAVLDMIATTVMTFGLTMIPVSVMQMLRGSMIIFSAIMSVLFLKRKLHLYHWIGVCCCVAACAIVGVSSIKVAAAGSVSSSISETILGISLVLVSQLVQAFQIVAEDFLLSNVEAEPLEVVGLEGSWGFLLCVLALVVIYFIPGKDVKSFEDTIDTIHMVCNSTMLQILSIIYWVCILFLNYAGMLVTSELSAVVRTMWEGIRTAAIWLTNILIAYVFFPHSVFGEEWTAYSLLQLAGFLTLLFSTYTYNGIIKFPFFRTGYLKEMKNKSASEKADDAADSA